MLFRSGNDIAISSSFTRSITTTVTASAAKLGSGATDPSLATALAAVAGERYHLIVVLLDKSSPFGEADDHVALESDGEHGRGEVALIATTGTLGAATTIAAARNSARAVQWWCKGTTSSFVRLAAAAAAVMASETNAAMPYNTLVLPGILPPTIANRPTPTEIENALAGGVAPIVVNASGKLAMVRAVTTRTLNDSGLPDGTLRDVNVVQIFDRIRDALASMFSTRYGRRIWADDDPEGLLPPYVATPAKVKEDALVVLRKLQSDEGIVQRVDELADDFVVQKVGDQCQFSLPTDMTRGLQAVLGKVALFLV